MSEEEKVKIELEVPKDQLKIEGVESKEAEEKEHQADGKENSKKEGSDEPVIADYKASDILKAPFETPEPESKRPPNRAQKKLVIIGFGVAAGGLLVWPAVSSLAGWLLIATGAGLVAVGTLVRL